MSFEFEGVLTEAMPADALSPQLPSELWEYARAFLRLERASMHFIWQARRMWLDVTLERQGAGVLVRVTETELPLGVTARELDVLSLTALGLTNAGIAERLGTAVRTVSTQLERLLKKLSQPTRSGLAAIAVDAGLLRLPLPGGALPAGGIAIADLELAVNSSGSAVTPIRMMRGARAPIPLGLVVPIGLGGDSEELRRGARLAVAELNRQGGVGGRLISLVEVDVEMFDWRSVRAGLEELFDAEVAAICTGYISAEHPEFLEVIADYGCPFLHTASFGADVLRTEADPARYSGVFQTCASETYYGMGLLRLLDGIGEVFPGSSRRILPLEQGSQSTQIASETFVAQADARGWEVLEGRITPPGATDWPAVIAHAHEVRADVLFIANYFEAELVAFQQALLRNPLPALVYAVYGPSVPEFSEQLGAQADGVVWATVTGTYDDDLGRRFRRQYSEQFQREPGWSQAGAAYDQVRLLGAAWSAVDARNPAEVADYLRRWPQRGVNGMYYFGEHGHEPRLYPDTTSDPALSQAHLIYQIQGRSQVLLGPEPFGSVADFRLPGWMHEA